MVSPTIDSALVTITGTNGVLDSVLLWMQTANERQQAAIDAALANGATAEQLAQVQAELDLQKTKAQAVADAIAANP